VFKLHGTRTGQQMTSARAGRVISEIGELAGVLVNKAEGKFATAHDLRRSFGTRWAPRVKPATLQLLMRHRSIETTMKYYVSQNADEVAHELWSEYGTVSRTKAS
jgi:integrase